MLLMLLPLCLKAMAGHTIVSAKLDNERVMMGKTVNLHINIIQDADVEGIIINTNSPKLGEIDIVGSSNIQTKDADNNRKEVTQTLTLQPFEPGAYELPPIQYKVGQATISSNKLQLLVDSIQVDTNGPIKDYKPPISVPSKIIDYIPNFIANYWWAWLAGIALLAFLIFAYFKWFKKGINPLKPTKKRLPPYEEAMKAFSKLRNRKLWQNGQEKEYFSQLTDILRVYIERRFGINAVEMTSSEIMESIQQHPEANIAKENLYDVLETADFVKFAKMKTLANDNEKAFNNAVNFVEATKPVPVASDDPNANTGKEVPEA